MASEVLVVTIANHEARLKKGMSYALVLNSFLYRTLSPSQACNNMDSYIKTGFIIAITLLTTLGTSLIQQVYANSTWDFSRKAPIDTAGDNVYIVWFTDKGTPNKNDEVMFKASTDGGKTFGNKTNLSNTPTADSINAEINAAGNNVYVTWWERNQTSNEPVLRVSNDNGKTFGEIMRLSSDTTTGLDVR